MNSHFNYKECGSKFLKFKICSRTFLLLPFSKPASDILSVSPASTYIIKSDLQGYDCRALSDNSLYTSHFFIPYIHMEFSVLYNNSDKEDCDRVVDVLMGNGYIPYMKLGVWNRIILLEHWQVSCVSLAGSWSTLKSTGNVLILWTRSTLPRNTTFFGCTGIARLKVNE